jgi:hypothetical protein
VSTHPFAAQFEQHLRVTQQAYVERRSEDYLAGFADLYYSVQLGSQWGEDKAQLARKIARDIERFELISMELRVLRLWFSGEIGYGHLRYRTRLQARDGDDRVLIDRRENILVGEHSGNGSWLIASKIVVRARNYYESEADPDI